MTEPFDPASHGHHFLGRCRDCDSAYLVAMSYDQVESWFNQGVIGSAEWEGYRWAWRQTPRFSDLVVPFEPLDDARGFGERLLANLTARAVSSL